MFNELPIGSVVRLRNDTTVTIIERPANCPFNQNYPVIAQSSNAAGLENYDVWTNEGQFRRGKQSDYDMVAVVHYGPVGTVDPDVAEIDRLIEQLRELGAPVPKTCGALVPVIDRQAMIQTLRGLIPPTRVKAPVVAAVAEALKEPPKAVNDLGNNAVMQKEMDDLAEWHDSMQTKPINRIDRTDVENFRTGNYVERDALNQYQEIATRSAIYPGQGTPFGIMYTALGLAEAGEIQNKVKKMFRDDGVISMTHEGDNAYSVEFYEITPERRLTIMKEMGGNLWYLAALAKEIGSTLSEIAFMNLDELCGRTERDTLHGDGDNR